MKFNQYVSLREAEETQEIDAIFTQAQKEIGSLFQQLYKGTADMVRSYERAGLPENLQKSIFQHLQQIAGLVKGKAETEKMLDPRFKGPNPLSGVHQQKPIGDVTINTFAKSIMEMISEAAPLPGMSSYGTGPQGKPAYDFKTFIELTYREVMKRMATLKDAVFKHMGIIRDTHSKVLGLRNTAGNIRNRVADLQAGPPQPFDAQTHGKAEEGMAELARMKGMLSGGQLHLVARNGTKIDIDPSSSRWKQQVLSSGDRRFKLVASDGDKKAEQDIDMGNLNQIYNVASTMLDDLGIDSANPEIKPPSDEDLSAMKTARQPRKRMDWQGQHAEKDKNAVKPKE